MKVKDLVEHLSRLDQEMECAVDRSSFNFANGEEVIIPAFILRVDTKNLKVLSVKRGSKSEKMLVISD